MNYFFRTIRRQRRGLIPKVASRIGQLDRFSYANLLRRFQSNLTGKSILSLAVHDRLSAKFSSKIGQTAGPLEAYYKLVSNGEIDEDKNQVQLMERLQQLNDQTLQYERDRANGIKARSIPKPSVNPTSPGPATPSLSPSTSGPSPKSWFDVFFSSSGDGSKSKKAAAAPALRNSESTQSDANLRVSASTAANSIPKSVYVFGGTGCGKTFMMDLFFDNLPIKKKKRVHFNNFMIDIHKRLHRLRQQQAAVAAAVEGRDDIVSYTGNNTLSPLMARALVSKSQGGGAVGGSSNINSDAKSAIDTITDDLMDEAYVLCFDEFQVTDIADAMILKSLFEAMFNKGAVLVATSNRPPNDLYKNGIQRDLFVPFIHLLCERADVVSLAHSKVDYRLVKSQNEAINAYLSPIDKGSIETFEKQFQRVSGSLPTVKTELKVYGHILPVPEAVAGRRMAKFSFKSLCDEALGAADYIQLGQSFNVIFLSDIPVLNPRARNEMRRFITLVDALYEANVMVIFLAEAAPLSLLQITDEERVSYHDDEIFAFDRTVSRLLEMRSEAYRAALREKRPERAGGPKTLHKLLSVRAAPAPTAVSSSSSASSPATKLTLSTHDATSSKSTEASSSIPLSKPAAAAAVLIAAPPATAAGILDLMLGKNAWNIDAAKAASSTVEVNKKGRRMALRTVWQQYNWMKGKEENIPCACLDVLAADLKVLGVQLPAIPATANTKDISFDDFVNNICVRASLVPLPSTPKK